LDIRVDDIDGQAAGSGGDRGARGKVYYKEVLSPDEFTVFAKLRDVRKEIAQPEAVPVYTIFTNEQLAEMVKIRTTAKGDLEKIAGLGDARIEKYGARMIGEAKRCQEPFSSKLPITLRLRVPESEMGPSLTPFGLPHIRER